METGVLHHIWHCVLRDLLNRKFATRGTGYWVFADMQCSYFPTHLGRLSIPIYLTRQLDSQVIKRSCKSSRGVLVVEHALAESIKWVLRGTTGSHKRGEVKRLNLNAASNSYIKTEEFIPMKQGSDMASLLAGLVVEHAVKSYLLYLLRAELKWMR